MFQNYGAQGILWNDTRVHELIHLNQKDISGFSTELRKHTCLIFFSVSTSAFKVLFRQYD